MKIHANPEAYAWEISWNKYRYIDVLDIQAVVRIWKQVISIVKCKVIKAHKIEQEEISYVIFQKMKIVGVKSNENYAKRLDIDKSVPMCCEIFRQQ